MSENNSLEWVKYTSGDDGFPGAEERVVVEFGLSIDVNGRHFATALITPMMMEEFVVGYLFGQGVIRSFADVKSVKIDGASAEVEVAEKENGQKQAVEIDSDFKVSRDDIFSGVNAILKSKLYEETQAIHSAGIFRRGAEAVCIVEDIGRHNALDKAIGFSLMNNVDLKSTFAASTGRMVSEMVSKVCRAGIPVVATKTAVSGQGIELGEKCGLTVIGFVRDKGNTISTDTGVKIVKARQMKIYTYPGRVF